MPIADDAPQSDSQGVVRPSFHGLDGISGDFGGVEVAVGKPAGRRGRYEGWVLEDSRCCTSSKSSNREGGEGVVKMQFFAPSCMPSAMAAGWVVSVIGPGDRRQFISPGSMLSAIRRAFDFCNLVSPASFICLHVGVLLLSLW